MSFSRRVTSRAATVGIFLNVCPGAVASSPPTSNVTTQVFMLKAQIISQGTNQAIQHLLSF